MEITQQMIEAGAAALSRYIAPGLGRHRAAEQVFIHMLAVAPKPDPIRVTSEMERAGCAARHAHESDPGPDQVTAIYHAMRRVAPSLAAAQSTAMLRAELADVPNWQPTLDATPRHGGVKRPHDMAQVSELIQDDGGDTERRAEQANRVEVESVRVNPPGNARTVPVPVPTVELRVLRSLFAAGALTTDQYQLAIQALGGIKHVG